MLCGVWLILPSALCVHIDQSKWVRRFYWMDPFSYAQKAIAVNEFASPRWQAATTPAGTPLGLTILDQRGLPHERWSEAITAFVVPKPGSRVDEAALLAALKTRLGGFKVPKAVVVVESLPKTSTGKIQKNVVRREHADLYQGSTEQR